MSEEFAECLVNDCPQDLSTDAMSRLRNHNALQFERTVGRSQSAKNDVTRWILSLLHCVVGVVRVSHLLLVGKNVIAVNKTNPGEALLRLKKKGEVMRSRVPQLYDIHMFRIPDGFEQSPQHSHVGRPTSWSGRRAPNRGGCFIESIFDQCIVQWSKHERPTQERQATGLHL